MFPINCLSFHFVLTLPYLYWLMGIVGLPHPTHFIKLFHIFLITFYYFKIGWSRASPRWLQNCGSRFQPVWDFKSLFVILAVVLPSAYLKTFSEFLKIRWVASFLMFANIFGKSWTRNALSFPNPLKSGVTNHSSFLISGNIPLLWVPTFANLMFSN